MMAQLVEEGVEVEVIEKAITLFAELVNVVPARRLRKIAFIPIFVFRMRMKQEL